MKHAVTIFLFLEFLLGQIEYGFNFSKSGSAGFQFLMIEADALSAGLSGASSTLNRGAKKLFCKCIKHNGNKSIFNFIIKCKLVGRV